MGGVKRRTGKLLATAGSEVGLAFLTDIETSAAGKISTMMEREGGAGVLATELVRK